MPVVSQAISVAPQDLIKSALLEAGIIAADENLSAADAAWGLEKLQRMVDGFNARRDIIFSHSFNLYTLTANHAPHTIGPGGDFNVAIRPVDVLSASFVLNSAGSNPVDTPVRLRDDDWWAALPLKSQVSSIVTDLYYDAAQGLGNLNFWPICNASFPVRLETWTTIPQGADLITPLGFVQGYWDAIVLSLAVRLCPSYNTEPSPTLVGMQREAMKVILANNDPPPRIDTTSGMPNSASNGRPDFNFLTGLRE